MTRPKRPRDPNQLAKVIADLTTRTATDSDPDAGKDAKAVARGKLGGAKGGTASDDRNPASILVSAGNGSVSLTVTANYKGRKITSVAKRAGSIAQQKERDFWIAIDTETAQVSLRSDPDGDVYPHPTALATRFLREAFTGKWVD